MDRNVFLTARIKEAILRGVTSVVGLIAHFCCQTKQREAPGCCSVHYRLITQSLCEMMVLWIGVRRKSHWQSVKYGQGFSDKWNRIFVFVGHRGTKKLSCKISCCFWWIRLCRWTGLTPHCSVVVESGFGFRYSPDVAGKADKAGSLGQLPSKCWNQFKEKR